MAAGTRSSAYSTISVRTWSDVDDDLAVVKRDLQAHFKPLFEKHGPEGVLITKLRQELESQRTANLMSRQSLTNALTKADKDGDEYLSFQEFTAMITADLKEERRLAFRGMLLSALGHVGVLPKRKRDDFLANYTICPPPLFIPIITLVQIIIFIVYVVDMDKRGLTVTATDGYPTYSPLTYNPKRRYEVWRFFTYMFIHDGYLHIVFNVVTQLLFGFCLEIVHGWWRVAIVYLCGVTAVSINVIKMDPSGLKKTLSHTGQTWLVSGSFAHSVVDPWVGLIGASGGVYALLGAHLAAVVTNWKEMNYHLCNEEEFQSRRLFAGVRIFASAPFRMAMIVLIVLPDTGLAIFRRVALNENLRVGVSAHVGGFLTGLFLGIPVLRNINEHAWETNLGWVTLVVFLAVCAFAVFFNAFHTGYPPTDWS